MTDRVPDSVARRPVLVVMPDAEARADPTRPIFGRPGLHRLSVAAHDAGFAQCLLAPGTSSQPPQARPAATGDVVDAPALVVFEGTYLDPRLLALMVEHPLDPDERFTLYDACGRPAACFVGRLGRVPAVMPVAEELPWPEELGPADVVRVVYPEDQDRAEALVLRSEVPDMAQGSLWQRHVDVRTVRWLSNSGRPKPQLELTALALALGSLPISLLGEGPAVWVAATFLLIGVHVSRSLPIVDGLRRDAHSEGPPEDRLVDAIRPLGQAVYMGGLTYAIVAQTDRSGASALVLLVAGAAAAVLSLVRARRVLRGRVVDVFALPDAHAVARRLGVRWPGVLDGAPFVELTAWLCSFWGAPELPWSVMAAGAVARLWRWFSGPEDLFPRRDATSP